MTKRSLVDEASNPETPFQRLLKLSESKDDEVRRALVENPSIAVTEDGDIVGFVLCDLAEEFANEIFRSPAYSLFGIELKDPAFQTLTLLLAQQVTDPESIRVIFREFVPGMDGVGNFISTNPSTPGDVLDELIHVEGVPLNVRMFVAEHENALPETLRELSDAKVPGETTRSSVAGNKNTPDDVLRVLGNIKTEPSAMVRNSVALNPNTPADVLAILGSVKTEPSENVRSTVLMNRSTPHSVVVALSKKANEPSPIVRDIAKRRIANERKR